MPDESSIHEAAARARKVARLAAVIPYAPARAGIDAAANALASATAADRAWLAAAAGVRAPSDVTWTALVATVRARRPGVSALRSNRRILNQLERTL